MDPANPCPAFRFIPSLGSVCKKRWGAPPGGQCHGHGPGPSPRCPGHRWPACTGVSTLADVCSHPVSASALQTKLKIQTKRKETDRLEFTPGGSRASRVHGLLQTVLQACSRSLTQKVNRAPQRALWPAGPVPLCRWMLGSVSVNILVQHNRAARHTLGEWPGADSGRLRGDIYKRKVSFPEFFGFVSATLKEGGNFKAFAAVMQKGVSINPHLEANITAPAVVRLHS